MKKNTYDQLVQSHQPLAVTRRLNQTPKSQDLSDAILGGIDGCVTTFAIVSGSLGAGFSSSVALIMGFANLFADGFSMAVSNYESIKAQREFIEQIRLEEEMHIDTFPEGEREEIRQIFQKKGFTGEILGNIVDTICSNRSLWIETMIVEEHGLQRLGSNPVRSAFTTFIAFLIVGAMPLVPFLLPAIQIQHKFILSTVMAAIMFFMIGALKGLILSKKPFSSGLGTLATGSVAAAIAFFTGLLLRDIFNIAA